MTRRKVPPRAPRAASEIPAPPRPWERETARLAESFGRGFALLDLAGRMLLVNRRLLQRTGLDTSRLALVALLEALETEPSVRQEILDRLREISRAGGGFERELGAARGAGRTSSLLRAVRHEGAAGEPSRIVLEFDFDGNAGGPLGAELRRRRSRTLTGHLAGGPDLQLVLDDAGRILVVGGALERLTGYGREEVLARPALRFLTRRSLAPVRQSLGRLRDSGGAETLEVEIRRRSGRPLPMAVQLLVSPLEPGRVFVSARDLASREMLVRQLRLTDRLAATGRLAAGVAHEINNPLQAVLMHLSLVESSLGDDFDQQDSWRRLKEGIGRIREIVADLLDLHRGRDHGTGPVAVNRIVEEVLGLCRARFRQRELRSTVILAESGPTVRVPARHLYQIVLNLVLNALDVLGRRGRLGVTTRLLAARGEVEIVVADAGPGIPDKVLPHIFDPFRSAERSPGTGLGLFVTWGLVREYGGRVRVDTSSRGGTRFHVFFPVASS
ncbi:MAG: ATP-binding protein [Acidobacteriota bacterium]|nr:ATP-binding protein [Acidobacteriota bacterium]MDQ7087307.1 ATP-binding protein [Acidobacteriota bacterium]